MFYPESGVKHQKLGEAIEKTSFNGLSLALLASSDGTEIIHHHLSTGNRWVLGPSEGWNALEFVFVLSGALIWSRENGKVIVKAGDSLSMAPIKEDILFTAQEDTEFLYITSQPVFHHYSKIVKEMMDMAVSVEEKDSYTAGHCSRIMNLSMLVGEQLHLTSNEMYQLNLGSFLHDIGKIKVPSEILNKPGKLTNEEWHIMKKHTIYGREILESTNFPNLIHAAPIVEQHHERFDGTGYPYGYKGKEIPIGAAIVAVVDSYDAMTSQRVYNKAKTKNEALEEIFNGRDKLYHPDVVDMFLSISDKIDAVERGEKQDE